MKLYRYILRTSVFAFASIGIQSRAYAQEQHPDIAPDSPIAADAIALVAKDSTDSSELSPGHLRFPEQEQRRKLQDRRKIYELGGGMADARADSVRSLMDIFYTDQFRAFQDPEAPYFMLMSKDKHLAFGVGGLLVARGWFDWNGVVPDYIYSPYNITIPRDPAHMHELRASMANTGFFATLLGRNTVVGDFMAYIEGGFRGYNRTDFRLRKAYIQVKGFTAGLHYSTFLDIAALPPSVDGGTAAGTIDRANVLVRYQHNFKSGWSVAGALEFPTTAIDDDTESTKACSPFLPDVAAFGQYQWDEGYSHVRLSGLLRTLSYRNLLQQKNHNKLGWGIALSSAIKIIPNLSIYADVIYGAGHNGYLGDLSNGEHDLVAVAGQPGVLETPRSFSYLGGLKYNFKPELYASASFSQIFNYEKNPANPDSYKSGFCGNVNFFWEVTPRLTVGGGYIIGKRVNFSGASAITDRAEIMLKLSF